MAIAKDSYGLCVSSRSRWSGMVFMAAACSVLLRGWSTVEARAVIDPMNHDIGVVTQHSWNGKVLKFRDNNVFTVLFYNPDDRSCRDFIDGEYNKFAKKMKGMIQVLAVDCSESARLCKDNGATQFPHVVVFPTLPQPPFPYKGTKDLESLSKVVRPLIPSSVKSVANAKELEALLASTVQMPKALFFSDKLTRPSILLKALSNAFRDKLHFVLLNSAVFPEAVKRFKVTSFPQLVVVRKDKRDEVYKGPFEFQKLFDWLNVFSETFVMGGGFSEAAPSAEFDPELQPWKLEAIPELTKQSSQDVCFKKSNKFVCVVLVKRGHGLSEEEKDIMESLKEDYEGHQGKGPDFRFMWMDLGVETEWAELFGVTNPPSIVSVNPNKKVRFFKLDSDLPLTKPHVRKMLSKISSGDARFKIVPQAKIPKFVDRKDVKPGKDQGASEEL